jgi:mono/diheme cytochrome c family protein/cytochrome c553
MFRLVPLVLLFLVAAGQLRAQDEAEEDTQSPYVQGLVARYQVGDAESVLRIDESLACDWQAAAPDPRLPAGPFSAVWKGRLMSQAPGPYQLRVFAAGGKVALSLGGKKLIEGACDKAQWLVAEPVELSFDYHPLEVKFEKTGDTARLGLYWTGPGFVLEPVPERFLFHDRTETVPRDFERGRLLAAALGCEACHGGATATTMPAPALDKLAGNIEPAWLIEWLSAKPAADQPSPPLRRMPHLGISREEAAHMAAWLTSFPVDRVAEPQGKEPKSAEGKSKKAQDKPSGPSLADGERLFLTLGCLACHQRGDLGESGLFGGGDLSDIARKRPKDFFARWLADPASLNRHHRMPAFELSDSERDSLALYLSSSTIGNSTVGNAFRGVPSAGKDLVARFRCATCHSLPGSKDAPANPPKSGVNALSKVSDWSKSCSGSLDGNSARPAYGLAEADRKALQAYYSVSNEPTAAPQRTLSTDAQSAHSAGRDLLVQLNCLACHQREGIDRAASLLPALLSDKLKAVVDLHDELGKEVPAMTPPALNAVGDKLHDAALAAAIRREGTPRRPYLRARMPKFKLTDEQLQTLVAYFTTTDRIPTVGNALRGVPGGASSPDQSVPAGETPAPRLLAAGPRLVTTDGFACTSCHQVGSLVADKAPLNARGPDLSMLGKRIRREWFHRWCAGPARIVPRMEMPSIQVPVRGVLDENIDDQLAAVWHILNTPGFEPPEPNPVRVLRLSGEPERKEQPIVLNDVIKLGDKTHLFPLVIGLPNRHNVLFDLETGRLAAWWLGDTARQRTKGKTWYWEAGSASIFDPGFTGSEITLVVKGKEYQPVADPQFVAVLRNYDLRLDGSVRFGYRLQFEIPADGREDRMNTSIHVEQEVIPTEQGFRRKYFFFDVPSVGEIRLRLAGPQLTKSGHWDGVGLSLPNENGVAIDSATKYRAEWSGDGAFTFAVPPVRASMRTLPTESRLALEYATSLKSDQYLAPVPEPIVVDAATVQIAPGLTGNKLPLWDDIMPTAIGHYIPLRVMESMPGVPVEKRDAGKRNRRPARRGDDPPADLGREIRVAPTFLFTSLKGQVYVAKDVDGDDQYEEVSMFADGLATPYGAHQGGDAYLVGGSVDVVAKTALWRITDTNQDGKADRFAVLASGWGVTDDYHDWAVGLEKSECSYVIALPCQQDERSAAAARYRGTVLILKPEDRLLPDAYNISVLSSGHRFPMGLAQNREGALFVTDNQGNYNPFNELNHVRQDAHFGFINALEKKQGYKPPPLARPAIDIPHPWTRSVNGICFLNTPPGWKPATHPLPSERAAVEANDVEKLAAIAEQTARPPQPVTAFGPLEGHLIGCEYDTRRLIRMTLQKVGETYQGAAYPLSIPPRNVEDGLLGPIVCSVSPRGEIYVGNIRDSGWGAGNNIGDIVRITVEPQNLPCGIAEVRATHDGFTIDFFRPVDAKKALDPGSYAIASYRRESTPAYGGPNLDRRTEKVAGLELSPDAKRVTLRLHDLREGFVYEFQLKPLAPGKAMFHPAEAHYTLNSIP